MMGEPEPERDSDSLGVKDILSKRIEDHFILSFIPLLNFTTCNAALYMKKTRMENAVCYVHHLEIV